LDEPFSALDPLAIYNLKEYLISNVLEYGFIISTHQLSILDSFEMDDDLLEVVFMKNGVVV